MSTPPPRAVLFRGQTSRDFGDLQVNRGVVTVQRVETKAGEAQLKGLIEKHLELTGSARAKDILDRWDETLPLFWQLVPPSEKQTPEATDRPVLVVQGPATAAGEAPKAAANGQSAAPTNGKSVSPDANGVAADANGVANDANGNAAEKKGVTTDGDGTDVPAAA